MPKSYLRVRSLRYEIAFGLILLGLIPSAAEATLIQKTYAADRDAVLLEFGPTRDDGQATVIETGTIRGEDARSILGFDLSSAIDNPNTVVGVTLRLFRMKESNGSFPGPNRTLETRVYAIAAANRDWDEGNGSGGLQNGEASWNFRGSPIEWAGSPGLTTPGVDYDSTLLATKVYDTDELYHDGNGMQGGDYPYDQPIDFEFSGSSTQLSALIHGWAADHAAGFMNPGLLLFDPNGGEVGGRFLYYSKDTPDPAFHPQLIVTYKTPEPATLLLLSLALGTMGGVHLWRRQAASRAAHSADGATH